MNISGSRSLFLGEPSFRHFQCFPINLKKENYLLPMVSGPPVTWLLPSSPASSSFIPLILYGSAIPELLVFSQRGQLSSPWPSALAFSPSQHPCLPLHLANTHHPSKVMSKLTSTSTRTFSLTLGCPQAPLLPLLPTILYCNAFLTTLHNSTCTPRTHRLNLHPISELMQSPDIQEDWVNMH